MSHKARFDVRLFMQHASIHNIIHDSQQVNTFLLHTQTLF